MAKQNLFKEYDIRQVEIEKLEEGIENGNVTVKNETHYVNMQNSVYSDTKQEYENEVYVKKEELFENDRKSEDFISETDNFMDILNTNIKIKEEEIDIKLENESYAIEPTSLMYEEDGHSQSTDKLNTNMNCAPFEKDTATSYKDDDLEVKINKCKYCDYRTKSGHLKRHQLTHQVAKKQLKCATCSFVTIHKDSLRVHVNRCSHENKLNMSKPRRRPADKLYKCNVCNFQTNVKWYVARHAKLKHSSDTPIFKCHVCGLETKQKKNLRVHMVLHRPDSEKIIYQCSECSYQSIHKKCLVKHNKRKHNSITIKTETSV